MKSEGVGLERRVWHCLLAMLLGTGALVLSVPSFGDVSAATTNVADGSPNDFYQARGDGGIARFAGSDRYATSAALADAFAAVEDVIIVASGESLIDAAGAAGLAAAKSAPVLLTTPDKLSSSVRDFITAKRISEVYIVGGTTAVSQAVFDELDSLASVRTVKRLAGENRYATSAEVSKEMGTAGAFCGSSQKSALLVNVDSSFADVIALGPLAYALKLPVLLTSANSLSPEVVDYLQSAAIKRVVVIGGFAAISEEAVSQAAQAGASGMNRINGDTRYNTALAIRNALADCPTVSLSQTHVALVNDNAAADGVSAGPVLGSGALADDGKVVPVLLTRANDLPAETLNYFVSRTANSNLNCSPLVVTAIGGSTVVPDTIVQAALGANVAEPITASFSLREDRRALTVDFSSPVNAAQAGNKSNYSINGLPFIEKDKITTTPSRVEIELAGQSYRFYSGDVVALAGNNITGTGCDNRRVSATSFTVPEPTTLAPIVDIYAYEGSSEIVILAYDPLYAHRMGRISFWVEEGCHGTIFCEDNNLAVYSLAPSSVAVNGIPLGTKGTPTGAAGLKAATLSGKRNLHISGSIRGGGSPYGVSSAQVANVTICIYGAVISSYDEGQDSCLKGPGLSEGDIITLDQDVLARTGSGSRLSNSPVEKIVEVRPDRPELHRVIAGSTHVFGGHSEKVKQQDFYFYFNAAVDVFYSGSYIEGMLWELLNEKYNKRYGNDDRGCDFAVNVFSSFKVAKVASRVRVYCPTEDLFVDDELLAAGDSFTSPVNSAWFWNLDLIKTGDIIPAELFVVLDLELYFALGNDVNIPIAVGNDANTIIIESKNAS